MPVLRKNYSKKTDEELMRLLTQGGQPAFDELYKRYSKSMLNFFYRMLNNNRERAEDMLHDLFLKIIERPERFDQLRGFSTWFYTLAGNMVKNEYRNRQVRDSYEQQSFTGFNEVIEPSIGHIDKQLFDKQLAYEIDQLDTDTKIIFDLRFREEMSIKEIAEIIDCPEGTVKSRLFYLTKQLSKKLIIYKPELN